MGSFLSFLIGTYWPAEQRPQMQGITVKVGHGPAPARQRLPPSNSTGTPQAFDKFGKLPPEIRLQIWELALPLAPRILELKSGRHPSTGVVPKLFSREQAQLWSVSREARGVAEKYPSTWEQYGIQAVAQDMSLVQFGPNFEMDDFRTFVGALNSMGERISKEKLNGIKVLILEYDLEGHCIGGSSRYRVNWFPNFYKFAHELPQLERVIIIPSIERGGSTNLKGDLILNPMEKQKDGSVGDMRMWISGFLPLSMRSQFQVRNLRCSLKLDFMEFEEVGG